MEEHRTPLRDRFVLDSSLALSWFFNDEKTEATAEVLKKFADGAVAIVPHLWAWEVNNILGIAERTKRLSSAQRVEKASQLQRLLKEIDHAAHNEAWTNASTLARDHKLSLYDATYLEMAIRL